MQVDEVLEDVNVPSDVINDDRWYVMESGDATWTVEAA
jgi:hypothetical protein